MEEEESRFDDGNESGNWMKTKRKNQQDGSQFERKKKSFLIEDILELSNGDIEDNKRRQTPATLNNSLPAWIFCTRYSDRPSSGPRQRKVKKKEAAPAEERRRNKAEAASAGDPVRKRPRTAFSKEQLKRLQIEFRANRYLTEERRSALASELGLGQSQVKIWFQNKRAKLKKKTGAASNLQVSPSPL